MDLVSHPTMWALFVGFVVGALVLDLGILNRKSHTMTFREALFWCGVWVFLALAFCGGMYFQMGQVHAMEFLAGYLVELSLSVDNLFAFIMIFEFFRVSPQHQHRVLFWGIIGAIVLRATFIFAGLKFVHEFEWLLYVIGAFLVYIGIKMALGRGAEAEELSESRTIKILKKIFPISENYNADRFLIKEGGRWKGTPLLLVLLAVEVMDVVFAVDSIPAVIAVTRDSFVVFTSNIFAILGLRSMYFLLTGVIQHFHYLNYGVGLILVFVGSKMLCSHYLEIGIGTTLIVMISILSISIIASLLKSKKQ